MHHLPTPRPSRSVRASHTILLFVPIVLLGIVLYIAAMKVAPFIQVANRESRIKDIYSSLRLDNSYIPQTSNIFGDIRAYSSNSSQTYASTVTFIRPMNVDNTVTDLTRRIKAAGFTYLEQSYPGSASRQYHFKSAKNEYVRINVSSKPRDDAIENKFLMKQPLTDTEYALDANAGPSDVSIKVNLDTNSD